MPILRARGRASHVLFLATLVGLCAPACKGDDECQAKLAGMRRTFQAIPTGAATQQVALIDPDFPLLTSSQGEALRTTGPVVRLNADGSASIDRGKPSFDLEAVVAEAADVLTRPGHDKVLYLAIPPGVALGPHSPLIRRLGDRAPLRVLVRDAGGTPAAPTPSPAMATRLAALRGADASQKATQMAEAMRATAGECKPLAESFESLAGHAPDKRQGALINGALAGAEQCGCDKVDVDGLAALIWTLTMGDGPPLRWLPLLPGPAGLKLPADGRTGDLVRLLEAGPAIALPG
ncbi:MAG TPA: hypothetical protein VGB85_16530 [Nannocystis sp.]|jgi:hypothetical protein